MTRIAVLMTCHNRRTATLACLSSLENQINNSDFSLTTYLVDDGCTDGTAEAVANHPKIHIIRGDGNLYWNRGMQLAFSTARRDNHDGYLWLNDDVVLDQDALSRLSHSVFRLRELYSPNIIVVGSMRDPKTGKVTYGGLSRSSWIRPLKFIKVEPGESEIEIDTMNGNFVYVPNEVTKLVGNLDPEFEHMWGDMDYGLRARAVGVRIWLMPGTIGFCSRNPASKIWCAPGIGIRERWSRMNGPRGIPWRNWGLFAKRHGGPFWLLYAFWAYRGFFFRTGKIFQTIPGTKLATKADAKIGKD